jgi:hypothetical protein
LRPIAAAASLSGLFSRYDLKRKTDRDRYKADKRAGFSLHQSVLTPLGTDR